ncbi:ABC transporter ATP-binding protein [Pontimonas sp.]|nr:ABC transporter ATP-binding protein [Pontimonas sp.]
MSDLVVELTNVRREYQTGEVPTVALADVSLEVRRGEFVAIVGPSGSGKSTLMNLIGCLDRPSSGTVKISGRDISTLDDNELTALRSKAIGFVFQQFQLLPLTSAVDNVATPLLYQGVRPREATKRAGEMLARLGLGDRLDFDRGRLSGGQQQRVAISRALVTNPDLVLADEPTGALDTASGAAVMDVFREIHADGRTVVLITHDLEVAAAANRRIYIRDGLIERDEVGTMAGAR